jgi:hypothetical protein
LAQAVAVACIELAQRSRCETTWLRHRKKTATHTTATFMSSQLDLLSLAVLLRLLCARLCAGSVGCCVGHQVDTSVGLSPADHPVCVQQCGHVPPGHRPGPSLAHDWRHSSKVRPCIVTARQAASPCCCCGRIDTYGHSVGHGFCVCLETETSCQMLTAAPGRTPRQQFNRVNCTLAAVSTRPLALALYKLCAWGSA